ncbi:putative uncharacterized protein [Clostridium sp. CAG:505]|nr:putative uncharacterized protein [Clostridium sp. CAG:505]
MINVFNNQIFVFQNMFQCVMVNGGVFQITHTQTFFHVLITVNGRDAAASGAVFCVAQTIFFQTVQHNVIRHADDCFITDFQIFRCDGYTSFPQTGDFVVQVFQVDNHTVAHDIDYVTAQNAGRQQIQYKFALIVDNRMSCVIAALITADDIIFLRKQVDHTAFAFVTPVDANNRSKHKIPPNI